jgi:hypothetical protein
MPLRPFSKKTHHFILTESEKTAHMQKTLLNCEKWHRNLVILQKLG